MPAPRRRSVPGGDAEPTLFAADPDAEPVAVQPWPEQELFPVNRAGHTVGAILRADLTGSRRPLIAAGYSSIDQLVAFIATWSEHQPDGHLRVLLGTEPHPTVRDTFTSAAADFTEEVRGHWLRRGISLRLSATVVQALDAITAGRVTVRFVHGARLLHAKVYVGDTAATVGSSNFTAAGLGTQTEANTRFTTTDDPDRYRGLAAVGDNLWAYGQPWTRQLQTLLEDLLQVVGWEDALARACADLLEGDWAATYLPPASAGGGLWPSQRAGIAQALWIIREVGSVLVADATGSGKTRMGVHLIRAVQDRLRGSGQHRRDLTVLTCPSAVTDAWDTEAVDCGAELRITTHRQLSRADTASGALEGRALGRAQVLAVDEAHNFLNRHSARSRQLRTATADHVLLFTATPINRGPLDLLVLVDHLGADNFDGPILTALAVLARRSAADQVLSPAQQASLRAQIDRFTVRRTKTMLNALIDREPDAYTDPATGRRIRYPVHLTRLYDTGETAADIDVAHQIRAVAAALTGIGGLDGPITVPEGLRATCTDQQWLTRRLASSRGLAAHHVLEALRSSRAALVEHLAGTAEAVTRFHLDPHFKPTPSGGQITKLQVMAAAGPPAVPPGAQPPDWLVDPARWAAQCTAEAARYTEIGDLTAQLSGAREDTKAAVIADLAATHLRVLAFDHRLITLAALAGHLHRRGVDVTVAVGGDKTVRARIKTDFAPDATGRAVALCSDAFNEGLNLQGASALVHLDLLTTVRAVEQRVGRIDRMNSPHPAIEVWWPRDTEAFATRANELLHARSTQNDEILGPNLVVPDLTGDPTTNPIDTDAAPDSDAAIDLEALIRRLDSPTEERWDGIATSSTPSAASSRAPTR